MTPDRRTMLGLSALSVTAAMAPGAAAAPSPRSQGKAGRNAAGPELVLLGTKGGPPPLGGERQGIASAMLVGGKGYLVDAGHGTYHRLFQAGIHDLEAIFVTHLHSDHIAELFTLPWLRHGGVNALPGPIRVLGPGRAGALPPSRKGGSPSIVAPENPTPGTVDFVQKSIEAAAYDLNIRVRDEGWPDLREVLQVEDITLPDVGADAVEDLFPDMEPFPVFEDDRVRVTATLVAHPPVFPALGFRFDTEAGSVVFSGDTGVSENLIRLAAGADYLVHEVIDLDWVSQGGVPESLLAHLAESHTDVTKIGAVAEAAGARNLVLNHLVPADPKKVNDGQWRRRAQRGYSGKVHVGQDLMRFGL